MSCRVRWVIGMLLLIVPAALAASLMLSREARRPVLERCPWRNLSALLVLVIGLVLGITVIFGCHKAP